MPLRQESPQPLHSNSSSNTAAGSRVFGNRAAPRYMTSGHFGWLGMIPSSLKRSVLAFRSRTRALRLSRDGRDQPVTFSAIFFASSSMGMGVILFQVREIGSHAAALLAFPQVLHQLCERKAV